MTFDQMNLDASILSRIHELGFWEPTPVQEKTIPFVLKNRRDLIALAQTGTGKTAAYGLPLLERIRGGQGERAKQGQSPQVLILCPTRELCLQVSRDLDSYSQSMKGIDVLPVYGGTDIRGQMARLKKGTDILVATPGRLLDLLQRKKADLSYIHTLVLDEADEMLNMGFQEDINSLLAQTPADKQTLLFSATMPREVAEISMNYMTDPHEITIGTKNAGAENIDHIYYMVHAKDRYLVLKRIADIHPDIYGLIFCRTRKETKEIADALMQEGYNADALHGDLSQAQRDYVMDRFRSRQLQLLVATDVASRGLDVDDLTHVIHYSLPEDLETYTHRSGRTGRAGKSGTSIAIVNMKEKGKIKRLEKIIKKEFRNLPIPSVRDIYEKQLFNYIDKMENVKIDEEQIAPYAEVFVKKLSWLTKEDLIKRFVSLEFNRLFGYYKDADISMPDPNIRQNPDSPKKKKRAGRKFESSRYFISIGHRDGIKPKDLLAVINKHTRGADIGIGGIAIKDTYSFFETDPAYQDIILASLAKGTFRGRDIRIELAQEDTRPRKRKN